MTIEQKEWLFSFGYGHLHQNQFIRIKAFTPEAARQIMVAMHGRKWALQYEADQEAVLQMVGMTEYIPDA